MEQESIKCLLNRAASYQRLGRFHAAAADCRSVLAMNEDHPKALFRLGKALMGSRQLEQAVEALTSAAKMEPNDASVRGR
jgi:tetratricopeptide (TPR) repeat protein